MLFQHVPPSELAGWGRHPAGWPGRRPAGRATRPRRRVLTLALPLVTAPLLLGLAGCADQELPERQASVAERGAEVMPFDLDATTHRWTATADGVVQVVVADDPGDARQIALVREHLRSEAERFAAGDFSDPAAIHGQDMPGLALLRGHGGRISVAYRELDSGAELVFTTADQELVAALHDWAEAQLADHGPHAEH